MNRQSLRRGARIALWTIGLSGFLFFVDRVSFGPTVDAGWNDIGSIQELSRKLPGVELPLLLPPYLPSVLSWPPHQVLFRVRPAPGWWLSLKDSASAAIPLWIGSGVDPLPKELSALRPCMEERLKSACPEGWHFASAQLRGDMVVVFSKLNAQETKRILLGLELLLPSR